MHLILTGATGTVGSPILRHCIASPQITRLSILARYDFAFPPDFDASKAHVLVHKNFSVYGPDVLAQLEGAEGCIWAQGTSQNAVRVEEYVRITYAFPVAAAEAFASLSGSAPFKFVHISGKGAVSNASLYGRTKARAEKALLALADDPRYSALLRVFNVRPAYVDTLRPGAGIARKAVYYGLAPVLRRLAPGSVTPTDALARVCVDLALGDGHALVPMGEDIIAEGRTLLSASLRRLGETSDHEAS
ncbi:hypothetical protein C8R44DRAFT_973872 [Mycena epipterygia]|nr:hypothetical protein C8R44DRAFT_973872 [Mycena epipterygia]